MKNEYGFIPSRYIQPHHYKTIFSRWNAVYILPDGKEAHIEAIPHYLCSEKLGANIDHLQVLTQEETCRIIVAPRLKSFKAAMEVLEKLINNAKRKIEAEARKKRVRVTFVCAMEITGDTDDEIRQKWANMHLFSKEADKEHAEYVDLLDSLVMKDGEATDEKFYLSV